MTPAPLAFPLNKTLDPADYDRLGRALSYVNRIPDALEGQHAQRRWEYAMAVEAILQWIRTVDPHTIPDTPWPRLGDVGGAGSNLYKVLGAFSLLPIDRIDPLLPAVDLAGARHWRVGLDDYAAGASMAGRLDVLCCISTIEHVPQPALRHFLRAARTVLRPGGLLFLTTDYWNLDGPDTAHFHWMRERIYNPDSIRLLQKMARSERFEGFGRTEWAYHGPQVYDYTFASLALVAKEPA